VSLPPGMTAAVYLPGAAVPSNISSGTFSW
jgi:hypothetical protein